MTRPGRRPADYWFDTERFVADVEAFRKRRHWLRQDLLRRADINHQAGYAVLRGDRTPSLGTVCALASVCDLSIDSYVLPPC
jgi:transcriptional regulator with XRE-family HTH domain